MKKLLSQIVTAGIAAAILFLYAPGASAQDTVIVSVSGDLTGAVGTRGSWFTPILDYSKPTVSGEVRSRAALSGRANYAYIFSKRIATSFIVNVPNDSITWRLTVTIGAVVVFDQTYTNLDDSDFTKIVIPLGAMPAGEVEVVQRVEGYGNVTVARSAMYGESGTFNCTCAPAPVAGTLTANPPSGIPGAQASVTGAVWDNGRTSVIYRLLFDGKLVAAQGDLICCTQPNMTFDIPCDTPPGPHTITNQLVDIFTQQVLLSKQITFQVSPLSSLAGTICAQGKVVSVEFAKLNGSFLDLNPKLGNELPGYGGGVRLFPDADSPTGQPNRQVIIKVKVTPAAQGTTVYLRSFDVDDSSGLFNNPQHTGNDNQDPSIRGDNILREGEFDGFSNARTATAATDSNGVAIIKFNVTMQPGDNFKIAAGVDKTLIESLVVDGQSIKDPKTGKAIDRSGNTTGADVVASDLLTIWRYLHIEVDSMPDPPNVPRTGEEVNHIRGNITQITTQIRSNTPVRFFNLDQVVRDNSNDLGATPPSFGRFEHGELIIGEDKNAVTISDLGGNGEKFVVKAGMAKIPCELVDKKGENKISTEITDMIPGSSASKTPNKFVVAQQISNPGRYNGGSIIIAGISFTIDKVKGNDVELNSSASQPAFQLRFLLNDDDQISESALVYPSDFALMQASDIIDENLFAATYIRPVFDLPSLNAPKFKRNIEDITELTAKISEGRDWFSDKDFWVAYVQGAWQEKEIRDQDPDNDVDNTLISGATPQSALDRGCLIYVESNRDTAAFVSKLFPHITKELLIKTTTVHEVGHLFGLPDRSGNSNGGIMEVLTATDPRYKNISSFAFFIPDDQKLIRRRIKP